MQAANRGNPQLRTLLGLAATWLVVFAFFSWRAPQSFATGENLETLARQTAIVGFAAIGMTFIIVAGAIDLSVGSMVAFVTVAIAWLLNKGASPELAALAGVLIGAGLGGLNGLLVTQLRVNAFIVTLGSLLVLRGAAKGIADERTLPAPMTWLAELLARLGPSERWKIVPPGVWLVLLLAIAASLTLSRTRFGRQVVAVGSNERAAAYSGISPSRVRWWVFGLGGFFAGWAGLMQFSRLTIGDPTVAVGLELDVIAAVVIGGASLSGGQGSVAGSLLGALIMATLRAGCSQIGLSNWVQEILTGSIIVVAVALDRFRSSRELN